MKAETFRNVSLGTLGLSILSTVLYLWITLPRDNTGDLNVEAIKELLASRQPKREYQFDVAQQGKKLVYTIYSGNKKLGVVKANRLDSLIEMDNQ